MDDVDQVSQAVSRNAKSECDREANREYFINIENRSNRPMMTDGEADQLNRGRSVRTKCECLRMMSGDDAGTSADLIVATVMSRDVYGPTLSTALPYTIDDPFVGSVSFEPEVIVYPFKKA
jgi:hypothetical protein